MERISIPFVRPLRHRAFRRLWLGQALSGIGDGIFPVAVVLLITARGDASRLGLVLAAEATTTAVMLVFGGVLADRFRQTRMMMASDILQFLAVVGYSLLDKGSPLVLLMIAAAVVGCGAGFYTPAYSAVIGSVVPTEDLQSAVALKSFTTRTGAVVGPALGGLLFILGGSRLAFLIDGATFAISFATLLGVEDHSTSRLVVRSMLRSAMDGLDTVRSRPWLATVILQGTLQIAFVFAPLVLLLPIGLTNSGRIDTFGLLLAVQALGSMLGAGLASRWQPRQPGTMALGALLLTCGELLALALSAPIPVLAVCVLFTGGGFAVFGVLYNAAMMRGVPAPMLARVFSLDALGAQVLAPIALAATPVVVERLGFVVTLAVAMAVLIITTVAPLLVSGMPTFSTSQEHDP